MASSDESNSDMDMVEESEDELNSKLCMWF